MPTSKTNKVIIYHVVSLDQFLGKLKCLEDYSFALDADDCLRQVEWMLHKITSCFFISGCLRLNLAFTTKPAATAEAQTLEVTTIVAPFATTLPNNQPFFTQTSTVEPSSQGYC